MFKKIFLLLLLHPVLAPAQNLGIGTGNPQNKLHVAGGFRLDTLTGVGGAGLLKHDANGVVYGIKFTGNNSDVLRGDGSFGPANTGSFWSLAGNTGTNPATHFIGTTDGASLAFRILNRPSGIIDSARGLSSSGYMALSQNTSGTGNVAMGYKALALNTTGSANTSLGANSSSKQTEGFGNTAIGFNSLFNNSDGILNTAIGTETLFKNVTGNSNVAVGNYALSNNISQVGLVAVGSRALEQNVTGADNTAVGYFALYNNVQGLKNTATGTTALLNNKASYNTAFGAEALKDNTSGAENTAVGAYSLQYNVTGSYNVGLGYGAIVYNNSGIGNTATGYLSMSINSAGQYNTASGYKTLYNSNGNNNAVFGAFSSYNNGSGYYNTAMGSHSFYNNNTGFGNVALGVEALYNSHSNGNTAVGFKAGYNSNTGANQTLIGNQADVSITNLDNATALGFAAVVNANNKVVIGGNFAGMVIGGFANWSNLSDGRFKEDITENVPGLNFILKLRPVTYTVNLQRLESHITQLLPDSVKNQRQVLYQSRSSAVPEIHTGFIAQEVEALAKNIGYNFDGVNTPKNAADNYSISYSQFVMPLVKAIQEQQAIIEKQQKQIDALWEKIKTMENK